MLTAARQRICDPRWGQGRGGQGKPHYEFASLVRAGTRGVHAAAMQFDQALDERQADAEASLRAAL